jgi:hypothetical protein
MPDCNGASPGPGARVSFTAVDGQNGKGPKAIDVRLEDEIVVRVFLDGTAYCALLGSSLQEGIAGFGSTQAAALVDLGERLDANVGPMNDGDTAEAARTALADTRRRMAGGG